MIHPCLVPRSSWGKNVRNQLSQVEWDLVRNMVHKFSNRTCKGCGVQDTPSHPIQLHCHEDWHYTLQSRTQILMQFVTLCHKCHAVVHIGRTQLMGKDAFNDAKKHMMEVNKQTLKQVEEEIRSAFKMWHKRCEYTWKLDVSFLEEFMTGRG